MVNVKHVCIEKSIQFIATGRFIEAMKIIVDLVEPYKNADKRLYSNTIIISSELHTLEDAIIGGRVTWEQENRTKSRIANRMLYIILKLEHIFYIK